jgi:hypothetical protein
MQNVRWANQATRDAFEALIDQPETVHVPCAPRADERTSEFADRLRTVVTALIRAVDEFGLEGAIRAWLRRVDDWRAVEWQQVAALLVLRATVPASPCPADGETAIAA